MITEDYVSFEIAKLLKEKGFNEGCRAHYGTSGSFSYEKYEVEAAGCEMHNAILAPTLQMVIKWLREVHHWHIFVIPRWEDVEYMPGEWEETMVGYQYVIINIGEANRKYEQPITITLSPESAYAAAIKYCLENLI